MLFHTTAFVFVFLPVTFALYCLARGWQRQAGLAVLLAASLVFYSQWNIAHVPLLVGSLAFNYAFGRWLGRTPGRSGSWLAVAVLANLGLLGYFKYAGFFLSGFQDTGWQPAAVALPLGISFYTFQQIAYLVDSYQGNRRGDSALEYGAAVAFFPHLIAGPIVMYSELIPQFQERGNSWLSARNFGIGISFFTAGLAKKLIFADSLSPVVARVFGGAAPTFVEAWFGALAFMTQLYFDFSGYSDMAAGLALLFNIRLPLNFDSPYRAKSLVDFWQRWHMTLSRFLREYVYLPLIFAAPWRFRAWEFGALFVTMLLGGLWHGAGWTFVLWGALHGIGLVVNHSWRAFARTRKLRFPSSLGYALTLGLVLVGWVLFRADSLRSASRMLQAMFGGSGVALPRFAATLLAPLEKFGFTFAGTFSAEHLVFPYEVPLILALFTATLLLPNLHEVMGSYSPYLTARSAPPPKPVRWGWRPSPAYAAAFGALFAFALLEMFRTVGSEFLYFNF